jgi:CBS domain containing-hemolysin-like protein
MPDWLVNVLMVALAVALVGLNGFFVAAEFALVKLRRSRVDEFIAQGRMFAGTARWLLDRLDGSLSACQLGITMASLGLGWVGEPAIAHLLYPLLKAMGITSTVTLHGVAFTVAFTAITSLHLVIGEQLPKIYAIRRPDPVALWCALPLKFFYFVSYPLLVGLNVTTSFLLRKAGAEKATEHDTIHTEQQIRAMLHHAHLHGELTRSEHHLLHAVFEFDDMVCRLVMVPRTDVVYLDLRRGIAENLDVIRKTKHSRYPVCEGSLDNIRGVVHIKDLVGLSPDDIDLQSLARDGKRIPETMPISHLLRQFQSDHRHMAFVVDEYGTVTGCVTLENVLEQIVGAVEDEFDTEPPDVEHRRAGPLHGSRQRPDRTGQPEAGPEPRGRGRGYPLGAARGPHRPHARKERSRRVGRRRSRGRRGRERPRHPRADHHGGRRRSLTG